mgnify:CR=1 FL=1
MIYFINENSYSHHQTIHTVTFYIEWKREELTMNENLECNMGRDENSDKKPTPHKLERVYMRSFACMLLLFSTYPLPLLRLRRFP